MTLDERIEQLMQPGCNYDPFRPDNLAESLANIDIDDVKYITEWLKVGSIYGYALIGNRIRSISKRQWKKLATTQAQADIDRERDEACPKCGGNEGKGCPACDVKQRREARE